MSDIRYKVQKNRINKSLLRGFELIDGRNPIIKTEAALNNSLLVYPFDCGEKDGQWGRLKMDISKNETTAYYVYVAAVNEFAEIADISDKETVGHFMEGLGAKKFVNTSDLLLYDLEGRYLYVGIQVLGEEVELTLCNMIVDRLGDNFMNTFPTIYRERNSFFHRYMSVLSSVFNDLEEKIDELPELLDLDTCPVELLKVYGSWLGIDLGDSLFEEDIMRALVKEAYQLNRMKGSHWCLERITQLFLGDDGIIIERNQLSDVFSPEQLKEYNKIYGESKYDVTLLLHKNLSLQKRNQLMFLLDQFLPVRCKLHIVELNQLSGLDSHIYLDINAQVFNPMEGSLDNPGVLDNNLVLL